MDTKGVNTEQAKPVKRGQYSLTTLSIRVAFAHQLHFRQHKDHIVSVLRHHVEKSYSVVKQKQCLIKIQTHTHTHIKKGKIRNTSDYHIS